MLYIREITFVLFLNHDLMCRAFYVFYTEHVVTLFLCIAGHIVQGLALREQHFQNVARLELRELDLGLDEGHRAVLLRDV